MDVQLRRPTKVHFGVATPREESRSRSSAVSLALDVVLRGLLIGVGIGVLLMTAHAGIASITVLGLLALGAALLSWDR
jgi:F0F1-type ATP synthase assembly protein I